MKKSMVFYTKTIQKRLMKVYSPYFMKMAPLRKSFIIRMGLKMVQEIPSMQMVNYLKRKHTKKVS